MNPTTNTPICNGFTIHSMNDAVALSPSPINTPTITPIPAAPPVNIPRTIFDFVP